MKTFFVAGATGYLGRFLVETYRKKGWRVLALVRNRQRAQDLKLAADTLIEAAAADRNVLAGTMVDVDLVVSALGITRQRDGLRYQEVDFQANANIPDEAVLAGVESFAYVHVLNAAEMTSVPLVRAKYGFVDRLRAAPVRSCVISPSGYFSDMEEFLALAKRGRIQLLEDGSHRLNPIRGKDLAETFVTAVESKVETLDVGGPDIFSQRELSFRAFEALGKKPRLAFPQTIFAAQQSASFHT